MRLMGVVPTYSSSDSSCVESTLSEEGNRYSDAPRRHAAREKFPLESVQEYRFDRFVEY